MKELERKPSSSESMRVRCPYCRKLYMVQFGDVVDSKPRFECVDCRTRFWLSLPDMDLTGELVGIPLQVKSAPAHAPARSVVVKREPCPKCFQPNNAGAKECGHCGVVFEKIKELDFLETRVTPSRTESLALAWKMVVSNYGEETVHDNFLRMAQREGHLTFAAHQYAQMLKLMPTDETTECRLRSIQALALQLLPEREIKAPAKPYSRLWLIAVFGATVFMFIGAFLPVFRSVAGIGAAFLFTAMVLKIQTMRR